MGRTAKEADVAMEAEPPGSIESQDVKHIVDAILDCALPYQKWVEKANAQGPGNSEMAEQHSDRATHLKAEQPRGNTGTWTHIATRPNEHHPTTNSSDLCPPQ